LGGFTIKMDLPSKIKNSLFNISPRVLKLVCTHVTFAYQSSSIKLYHLLDPSDAQSWYLLGRAYMAGQKYNKAYEAYQQAVYRDGRNPTFWCSIGVLYFQMHIHALFASIPTSPKSGLISAAYTRVATIKFRMR
jgi:tetratricopeptide (TPR) repeat protein